MPPSAARPRALGRFTVAATTLGLVTATLALGLSAPAQAAPSTGLMITEVYPGGGNAGATYNADFVELYNASSATVSLAGKSLQYRTNTSTGGAQHVRRLRAAVGLGAGALLLPRQGQRRHQRRRDPEDPGRVLLPRSRRDCRAGLPGRHRRAGSTRSPAARASRSAAASTTPPARSSTSSATAPARPATRARSRPAPSRRPGPTSAWVRRPTPTTTTPTSRSARSLPVRTTATASRRP